LGWVELGWVGLRWVALGWVGLGGVELGWVGLSWVGLGLETKVQFCHHPWCCMCVFLVVDLSLDHS